MLRLIPVNRQASGTRIEMGSIAERYEVLGRSCSELVAGMSALLAQGDDGPTLGSGEVEADPPSMPIIADFERPAPPDVSAPRLPIVRRLDSEIAVLPIWTTKHPCASRRNAWLATTSDAVGLQSGNAVAISSRNRGISRHFASRPIWELAEIG